jgi:hypothetical protein
VSKTIINNGRDFLRNSTLGVAAQPRAALGTTYLKKIPALLLELSSTPTEGAP